VSSWDPCFPPLMKFASDLSREEGGILRRSIHLAFENETSFMLKVTLFGFGLRTTGVMH